MHTRRLTPRLALPWLAAALFAFVAFPIFATGCNTTEGAGEDVQAVGESIEDAAEDAND